MANDWLIDVLADLKAFAQKNEFAALAAQLDRTVTVATSELAERERGGHLSPMGKGRSGIDAGGARRTH